MAHFREWMPNDGGSAVDHEIILENDGGMETMVIRSRQDITPILDHNQRLRGHTQHGTRLLGGKLAARVPTMIYWGWKREWQKGYREHFEWTTFLAMKLNDRDHQKFRIDPGRM